MDFTFGIVSGGSKNIRETATDSEIGRRINAIIKTIAKQNIPNYEIIVVGGEYYYQGLPHVVHVGFDENRYPNAVSRKKNIVTELANFDNIVYMHDYFSLDDSWYENMANFKEPWDIMMNQILDMNGCRFHDWVINPDKHMWFRKRNQGMETFLPYDVSHMTKYQYISGGYWIAKKHVMMEFPLDNRLLWGQGEDIAWSNQVMNKYNFTMNAEAIVRLIKPRFAAGWTIVGSEGMHVVNKLKQQA